MEKSNWWLRVWSQQQQQQQQYAYDVGGLSNPGKSRFKFINHKVTNDCGEAEPKTRRVAFDTK